MGTECSPEDWHSNQNNFRKLTGPNDWLKEKENRDKIHDDFHIFYLATYMHGVIIKK